MIYDVYFDYIGPDRLLVYLTSEALNLSFCIILISVLFLFKKLTHSEYLVWCLLFILAVAIGFFIQENIFPDIGGYLRCLRDFRDNFSLDESACALIRSSGSGDVVSTLSFKKGLPGIIYSFVPIPSTSTIGSIGIINKLILFGTFLYLKKNYFSKIVLRWELLILFLPTILVFSSIGLRDNLIFCFQVILFFSIASQRFMMSTIGILLLAMVKSQNAIIFCFYYFGVFIFRANINRKLLFLYCSVVFLLILPFSEQIVATINFFRIAFLVENGVPITRSSEFSSFGNLLINLPNYLFSGVFRPYPQSLASLVTFFENIIILFLITYFILKETSLLKDPNILMAIITCILGILLNSIVIENDFTFMRYKYTFSAALLVFVYYKFISSRRASINVKS